MPAQVEKRGDKYRVVEKKGKRTVLVRNDAGTPVDGGGMKSKAKATQQAQAINISQARKRGANIPKPKRK